MINQINTMSQAWLEYLVASSLQISVVFVLVLLLSSIYRNKSARFLHLLWFALIFKAIIPPSIKILNNESIEIPGVSFISGDLAFNNAETVPSGFTVDSIIVLVWAIAFIGLLSVFLKKNISLHQSLYQKRFRPEFLNKIQNSMKTSLDGVFLYVAQGISTPMTTGFIHPKIYLPEEAENWSKKKIELIVSHELAHIRRKDGYTTLLQVLIQIIYFFHPLVWFANRQISLYQEQACDDHALLEHSYSPLRYGNILLSFLEPSCATRQYSFIQGLIISDLKILRKRIKYLTKQKEDHMLKLNRIEKIILLGLLAFTLVLSCHEKQPLEQTVSQQQIAQNQPAVVLLAEEGMIIGSIVDKKTGEALPGANIFTSDTEYGAASNINGHFQFLLPAGTYKINAEFLGFKSQLRKNVDVRSGMKTNLKFEMEILSKKEFEQQLAEKENLLAK